MMRKETLSGSWLEQWRGFMASLRGFSEYGYEQMGVPQTNYDTDHQRFENTWKNTRNTGPTMSPAPNKL